MMKIHNSINKGKEITVTIDGKVCKSTFGKTILEIARENDIYVPTMCYLTKVQPIGSCRMCIVNVEGVDGMILSCQEKATDGAVINTNNEDIYNDRQNIMKLYNVNHPLECGVCDKSGECDLQNKTMEFGLKEQPFTARDQHRPVENWGHVSFDPALCIMCEKCVRVSTEITGDEALKVKFGGYGSTIINTKQDKNYASLGEAAAVCPVGALVSTKFKYTSNAWELNKIPSACPHCGGACEMSYEVKNERIYRISNTYEFSNLCGAGRYAYDYANENVEKDEKAFARAVEAFKKANTLIFSSQISNEEAFILQKLKEKFGFKLISNEARSYQKFMTAYSTITGKNLTNGTLKELSNSKAIIVMGSKINDDAPTVKYHMNMASKWHRARVAYMHPLEDEEMNNIVTQFIKYEAGSEEGAMAILANTLLSDIELPQTIRDYFEDLDIGNLSAESNIGEEELEDLKKSLNKKSGFSMIVGSDLYAHPRAEHIAKIVALLEEYAGFNVICIPPAGNAMGVSLICDLDDNAEGKTVGYNALADFTLSALGDGDLDMPAMNQQEGTLTSLDKRVVPMNVALPYGGYVLNDIANELGLSAKYTIDYTKELPLEKGFEAKEFDSLPNYFDSVGNENRGYMLSAKKVSVDTKLEEVEDIEGFDGAVIYNCNPSEQFSPFTAKSENLQDEVALLGSKQFAMATKLKDGEKIKFSQDGIEFNRVFKIDTAMKGTIAINPTFDMGLSMALLSSYRFSRLDFERLGS
ncbi:NADH-ubiquinone oxidoreductase chain G [hydrothermal vent metagenome]|uniref:NADH-ubiquinone oxidoreductase chain G n=1 Tax=hydrothermal vent metagenome TaxID=652676 RepID=A0A1W1EBV3_9ZZZZ